MKKISLIIYSFFATIQLQAQTDKQKDLFAFTITNYMVDAGDSIKIVQVQLPPGTKVIIEKEEMGLLKRNYSNVKNDSTKIGWGKCRLIKENYYYFGLHLYNKINKPQPNDLLYTRINYLAKYKGRIYDLVRNAIYFEHVTGGSFFDFNTPALFDEQKENSLIDSLVNDIKFTGASMLQQNDNQDQNITGGIFSGKKLFAAMQTIANEDVKKFIDYVIARPQMYAGNSWKIAETFATWMTSGTPTVIKNSN